MVKGNTLQKQAAVLLILSNDKGGDLLLLTERAQYLTHHPGEIAFPGGMVEVGDVDLFDTALRESEEEVGLRREDVEFVGVLPKSYTRLGVAVTPFVVRMITQPHYFTADAYELASMCWIPVSFFLQDKRVQTDIFTVKGREYWAPVYLYDRYRIWGFTARVLVDYLNVLLGENISRLNAAPEKKYI